VFKHRVAMTSALLFLIGLGLAAVLGLTVGGVRAAGGPHSNAQPQVVKLISRATAINNFVDIGPSGLSPGDVYVFSDRLFLASAPDTQIGISDGRCVVIDPSALRLDCSFTAKLQDGDILSAGTLMLVEGSTSVFGIVGGTGAYRNARGEVISKLGPFVGPHEVTGFLILNP
jgi:Allene oxide cyclase barrel like domain